MPVSVRMREASYLGPVAVGTTRTTTAEALGPDRVIRDLHSDFKL